MQSTILLLLLPLLTPTALTQSTQSPPKADWSGTLSTLDGGLQGTVTVPSQDDHTLSVTNYKLEDASAPALYWWGSASSSLADGFRISEKHVTEPSGDADTYTISLDAGKTSADFVTVGLWCEKFGANFGQATLAPPGGGQTGGSKPEEKNDGVAGRVEWVWVGVSAGLAGFVSLMV